MGGCLIQSVEVFVLSENPQAQTSLLLFLLEFCSSSLQSEGTIKPRLLQPTASLDNSSKLLHIPPANHFQRPKNHTGWCFSNRDFPSKNLTTCCDRISDRNSTGEQGCLGSWFQGCSPSRQGRHSWRGWPLLLVSHPSQDGWKLSPDWG